MQRGCGCDFVDKIQCWMCVCGSMCEIKLYMHVIGEDSACAKQNIKSVRLVV